MSNPNLEPTASKMTPISTEAVKRSEPFYSTSLTVKPVVSCVESKPTVEEVPTLSSPATSMKPPRHRNPELEKKLIESKSVTNLELKSMDLTNEDVEIVVYYILANNMVNSIGFTNYLYLLRHNI